jgi:hypothetical protein
VRFEKSHFNRNLIRTIITDTKGAIPCLVFDNVNMNGSNTKYDIMDG